VSLERDAHKACKARQETKSMNTASGALLNGAIAKAGLRP
jgi:hypothetical protein